MMTIASMIFGGQCIIDFTLNIKDASVLQHIEAIRIQHYGQYLGDCVTEFDTTRVYLGLHATINAAHLSVVATTINDLNLDSATLCPTFTIQFDTVIIKKQNDFYNVLMVAMRTSDELARVKKALCDRFPIMNNSVHPEYVAEEYCTPYIRIATYRTHESAATLRTHLQHDAVQYKCTFDSNYFNYKYMISNPSMTTPVDGKSPTAPIIKEMDTVDAAQVINADPRQDNTRAYLCHPQDHKYNHNVPHRQPSEVAKVAFRRHCQNIRTSKAPLSALQIKEALLRPSQFCQAMSTSTCSSTSSNIDSNTSTSTNVDPNISTTSTSHPTAPAGVSLSSLYSTSTSGVPIRRGDVIQRKMTSLRAIPPTTSPATTSAQDDTTIIKYKDQSIIHRGDPNLKFIPVDTKITTISVAPGSLGTTSLTTPFITPSFATIPTDGPDAGRVVSDI